MITAPQLPLSIRALNAGLGVFDAIGLHPSSLKESNLRATAQRQTGLSDFGDSSFEDGFSRLLASLESEAKLTSLGRLIAREEILMALKNRLQLVEYHRCNPDITAGSVERPIFIIGMGRSGTTILHELMALDTQLRTPLTWEVDHPFPPPQTASYESDPRIAATQKTLERTDLILPDFKKIHRMGAQLPQECVRWTTGEFTSMIFWTNYHVPEYSNWIMREANLAPAYSYHRKFLQLLQWKHSRAPWVLKSPGHLWSLDQLLQEYPDARFIQTHRDPLQILASLTSLVTVLRKMSSDNVDTAQIAREWAVWNAQGLNASASFRDRSLVKTEDVIDINFSEFMADPLRQVRAIYKQFDLPLSHTTERKMREYLAQHRQGEHGKHDYTFAHTGLDMASERARVLPYESRFPTEHEVT